MSTPILIALAAFTFVYFRFGRSRTPRGPLPRGPPPIPILGNLRDLTPKELWLPAMKWAKEYGDVCYLHILGQGLIFLSGDALFDLLDKRGSIYSDKPQLVMVGELCGCKHMVAFTEYGERFRRQRRLMHHAFGLHRISLYHPLLEYDTTHFLRRLYTDPRAFFGHIKRYAGGVTLLVVYGYKVTSNDDPLLALAEECLDLLANEITAGGGIWPVDVFPSLRHLPMWFPGAGFKRKAAKWKATIMDSVEKPYDFLKESMRQGTTVPSFCSTLIEEGLAANTLDETKEFDIKWTAHSLFAASIDTLMTVMSHFLLAMMQFPEVQARAQREIDAAVIEPFNRLPTLQDRAALPYVEALVSEALRWCPAVPLGLPHRLMEDDYYKGVLLPKGSLIFANIWSILRNEKYYPNPDTFDPERFLGKEKKDLESDLNQDPRRYTFGFGRRRCPGANLAEALMWSLIVSTLATFDVRKTVDEEGREVEPNPVFDNAVFSLPNPFPCDIKPRSEQSLRLIQGSVEPVEVAM